MRGRRFAPRWLLRHRRRVMAAVLAVTAVALITTGAREAPGPGREAGARETTHAQARGQTAAALEGDPRAPELVSAPVRITDAATVRLLRPGDRIDVVAAGGADGAATGDGAARVVASGVRVVEVPEPPEGTGVAGTGDIATEGGALVVLAVPRATATRLAGAGATSRLVVTLC
ncbi:RcpC/CpaB family pilus assembly protein [Streptomyces sp. NPDC058001]|uniref:RcpC/CpaB family pilus assembly protein n=1 Tax=Streptomyces sp. NPDC058001 TaxID=3346300 RepID=UPI0036E8DAEE